MSVKWKTMKVVFRYSESTSGPIIKPQWRGRADLGNSFGMMKEMRWVPFTLTTVAQWT